MRRLTPVAVFVGALCGFAVVPAERSVARDDPKPKTDAEQLEGTWELPVGEGKSKVFLQLVVRDGKSGQFQIVRPAEKAGRVELLGGAGFAYKLGTRDKKKVLLFDNCLWFDGKKAAVEYEFVDGKLRLGEGQTREEDGGIGLKGDWTRLKK